MNYCYGKGLCPLLGGCPYLRGSFIGGSTVYTNVCTVGPLYYEHIGTIEDVLNRGTLKMIRQS